MATITVYEILPEAAAADVALATFETGGKAMAFMRDYAATRPNCHTTAKMVLGSREVAMFNVRGG